MRVHGDTSGSESSDEQETTDDRHRLKEVVLEEVAHGPIRGDHPEGVQVHVQNRQPEDQHERRQLGPEGEGRNPKERVSKNVYHQHIHDPGKRQKKDVDPLVSGGDHDDEGGSDDVLDELNEGHFESQKGEEHEDQQNATRQLHVRLLFILSGRGQS